MVCPGLPEMGHEPHPVSGEGGERLTGDHPVPLALGGSFDQEPRVLCQGWNTRRGADTQRQVAALRGQGDVPRETRAPRRPLPDWDFA